MVFGGVGFDGVEIYGVYGYLVGYELVREYGELGFESSV